MTPFLKSIARAYASRYTDLSDFCFVFPNKRAGTFFLNRLQGEAVNKPMVAPRVTSITEMVEELSGRTVDNRIDALFLLYKAYRRLAAEQAGKETEEDNAADPDDFDAFRSWGETVLNDFGEVDMYGADPDEIFKNLKDFREIASDYLTDEQKRVMEEYFGYRQGVEKVAQNFWITFEPPSSLKGNYLQLWQTLGPLYHAFEEELAARGLTTPSGAYRLTLERLRRPGATRPARKMVFVGFNALSLTEREIMKEMTAFEEYEGPEGPEPPTDFFWDGTGPLLSTGAAENSPSKFLQFNRRDFPQPVWAEKFMADSEVDSLPQSIRVVSAPSKAIQAKIVGEELECLSRELDPSEFRKAKVAVVLPDESLLIPLLYSLPEKGPEVNLTMGYALRLTSAASFVAIYRVVQQTLRTTSQGPAYYHQHLRRFIGHPFVHAVAGSRQVAALNSWLNDTHRLLPTIGEIAGQAPGIAELLTPMPDGATPRQAAAILSDTLGKVSQALGANDAGGILKERLDRDHIDIYLDALRRLLSTVEEHGVNMSARTFFILADRMLGAEQVTFEGEPLRGLQVMGMLETRALDFDRVIIPSANEKYLPVKGSNRSFLPNTLRAAYHMPPMQHQENLAAYYFYRLISRAKEVVIIHDSRAGSGSAGEPSRYISQLSHLYAKGRVKFENRSFSIAPKPKPVETIRKSPRVMKQVNLYLEGKGGKNLSATSLATYCECGLRFFYERIAGIRTDDTPSEYIDAITQGNVVHEVLMALYLPEDKQKRLLSPGMLIEASAIQSILADRLLIKKLVHRSINKHHFHLPEGEHDRELPRTSELIATNLEWYIVRTLQRDLSLTPFTLLGCEIGEDVAYPISKDRKVNFRFVIDRMDSLGPIPGESLRIVDYKTSSGLKQTQYNGLQAEKFFDGDPDSKYPMQLLLYGELLNRWLRAEGKPEVSPDYFIYNIPKISGREGILAMRGGEGKNQLSGSPEILEGFRSSLNAILEELFDESKPFKAPAMPEVACKYCHLSPLCGR